MTKNKNVQNLRLNVLEANAVVDAAGHHTYWCRNDNAKKIALVYLILIAGSGA